MFLNDFETKSKLSADFFRFPRFRDDRQSRNNLYRYLSTFALNKIIENP